MFVTIKKIRNLNFLFIRSDYPRVASKMNLQQVEELCTVLFTTADSNARAEAGRKLEVPQNDQGILQCASLFENSANYFTAVYALSSMKQIVSRHRANVSEKTAQTVRMCKLRHPSNFPVTVIVTVTVTVFFDVVVVDIS